MRNLAVVAAVIAALATASAAYAGSLGRPCTSAPRDRWLTLDALKAKAEAMGYKVQKAKLKDACAEIYALDHSGARAEIFLDPTSGELVGRI